MDAISYSYADKQAKRIKKFNENPDSASGILTQPSIIQAGETVTIPAGRIAVLPNVQIDGVLNIENGGEVFIPSGATFSGVVEKVTSTDNAIVRFDGTTGEVQNSGVTIDDNGKVLVTSSTGGLGYGTGSGGTVTQLTSKGTTVTLNKPTGKIIMNNAALPNSGFVGFILNNTAFSSNDNIIINTSGGSSDISAYEIRAVYFSANTVGIYVKNVSGGSLSEALQINFTIIKGANS